MDVWLNGVERSSSSEPEATSSRNRRRCSRLPRTLGDASRFEPTRFEHRSWLHRRDKFPYTAGDRKRQRSLRQTVGGHKSIPPGSVSMDVQVVVHAMSRTEVFDRGCGKSATGGCAPCLSTTIADTPGVFFGTQHCVSVRRSSIKLPLDNFLDPEKASGKSLRLFRSGGF